VTLFLSALATATDGVVGCRLLLRRLSVPLKGSRFNLLLLCGAFPQPLVKPLARPAACPPHLELQARQYRILLEKIEETSPAQADVDRSFTHPERTGGCV
jgi:hypothetical protein